MPGQARHRPKPCSAPPMPRASKARPADGIARGWRRLFLLAGLHAMLILFNGRDIAQPSRNQKAKPTTPSADLRAGYGKKTRRKTGENQLHRGDAEKNLIS